MKLLCTVLLCFATAFVVAQPTDSRYFELRVYNVHPGQLDRLVDQFEKKTTQLFASHGMNNIGYWVPVSNEKNRLYYILAFKSKAEREHAWDAFDADPQWQAVKAKSKEKMVDSAGSIFMNRSDITPAILATGTKERVFELRTYTCLPGRLPNLITRFKDHTVKIFENHNMENVVYFTSVEPENVQPKLIYILAHPSVEAAAKSWAEFRADPEWIAARDASEKDGKIVEKVESVFLKPLGFSKIK